MNRHLLAAALAAVGLAVSAGSVSAETSDARSARKPAKKAAPVVDASRELRGPAPSPMGVKSGLRGSKPPSQVEPPGPPKSVSP